MPVKAESYYTLCFYVPTDHAETVKTAVFAAGAGRLGNYAECAWQTRGTGQFRPLPGSRAFIGGEGRLERIDEYKVEMLCPGACLKKAVAALLRTHPYETPAFGYWEIGTRLQS